MNPHRQAAMVCALAAGAYLAFAALPQPAPTATTGVLNGIVYGEAYGAAGDRLARFPVSGAHVYLMDRRSWGTGPTMSSALQTAKADNNGFFSFVSVEPGEYVLVASRIGWHRGCDAYARVAPDQVTHVGIDVVSIKMDVLCVVRPRFPTSTLDVHVIDPNGIVLNP